MINPYFGPVRSAEGALPGAGLFVSVSVDVMLFNIVNDEEPIKYTRTTRFEGLEEMGELVCDPRALREGYLEAVQKFLEEVRRHCSKNTIDFQTIRTSDHLDAALAHYLNHRIGMRQTVRS